MQKKLLLPSITFVVVVVFNFVFLFNLSGESQEMQKIVFDIGQVQKKVTSDTLYIQYQLDRQAAQDTANSAYSDFSNSKSPDKWCERMSHTAGMTSHSMTLQMANDIEQEYERYKDEIDNNNAGFLFTKFDYHLDALRTRMEKITDECSKYGYELYEPTIPDEWNKSNYKAASS